MGLNDLVTLARERFSTNVSASISNLSAQQWIRLIAIAGAYMLLRPYLMKIGGKMQMRQLEAEHDAAEQEALALAAKKRPALSPNDLRGTAAPGSMTGLLGLDGDSDSDDDNDDDNNNAPATSSGADWGKNARRRQRKMVRQLLSAHEKQLAEAQADEEDKDIAEFLQD
ncbi:duf1531 domain containing protein [Grosmannia clavigera kw1407]|uniref:Duf1531 domain containing protein n=1 Tax=Grosmannia clavigera (strain kw1407 / UAMH 11150) TaxID=655863 RepID=F0XLX7_GROCL|nr:duf1531 domain containing protein [Grosmannia clavigera kw1407]EFX01224.1 duf1531 domain containing protein [Grosmannia clavigera kw1407]